MKNNLIELINNLIIILKVVIVLILGSLATPFLLLGGLLSYCMLLVLALPLEINGDSKYVRNSWK